MDLKEFLNWRSQNHPNQMCLSRYVLENGSEIGSEPLTEEQRDIVDYFLIHFEPKAKECFFNAMFCCMVANRDSELASRIKYCEGFAECKSPFPVHHAWITLDGKVVDLTLSTTEHTLEELTAFMEEGVDLPRKEDLSDRVLGEIPETWKYFGVEFDAKEIAKNFIERQKSFSVIDDWEQGWPLLTGEEE